MGIVFRRLPSTQKKYSHEHPADFRPDRDRINRIAPRPILLGLTISVFLYLKAMSAFVDHAIPWCPPLKRMPENSIPLCRSHMCNQPKLNFCSRVYWAKWYSSRLTYCRFSSIISCEKMGSMFVKVINYLNSEYVDNFMLLAEHPGELEVFFLTVWTTMWLCSGSIFHLLLNNAAEGLHCLKPNLVLPREELKVVDKFFIWALRSHPTGCLSNELSSFRLFVISVWRPTIGHRSNVRSVGKIDLVQKQDHWKWKTINS